MRQSSILDAVPFLVFWLFYLQTKSDDAKKPKKEENGEEEEDVEDEEDVEGEEEDEEEELPEGEEELDEGEGKEAVTKYSYIAGDKVD